MLIIGGPTATGKTGLAVELALKYGGEIISADSMQIYKGMDIGTAKVSENEKRNVPHHLIDIIDPDQNFTVADFIALAKPVISGLQARGSVPIIAGGTGLYINALIYDYKLSARNAALRDELDAEYALHGADYMFEKLQSLDSVSAANIHKNNIKRVIRAIEAFLSENKSIADKNDKENSIPHLMYAVNVPRELLYERINTRVERMFELGLVYEVERLLDQGINFGMQSMQAIGYKEFKDYFNKVATLDQTKELIKQNSRGYAKRQLTWFKKIPTCKWLDFSATESYLDIIDKDLKNYK